MELGCVRLYEETHAPNQTQDTNTSHHPQRFFSWGIIHGI